MGSVKKWKQRRGLIQVPFFVWMVGRVLFVRELEFSASGGILVTHTELVQEIQGCCLNLFFVYRFGFSSTSSLQVGYVSVSGVGFVFSLNTINDNDSTINDT